MYAGGLLATLLILGLVLLVISLAVIISEPRNTEAPRALEHPAEVTRRLRAERAQDARSPKRVASTSKTGHAAG